MYRGTCLLPDRHGTANTLYTDVHIGNAIAEGAGIGRVKAFTIILYCYLQVPGSSDD